MAKQNLLVVKSQEFALVIIKMGKLLAQHQNEFVLSKQVIRSGTSIGANIAEAQHADSKKDFAHKLSIALKEARETQYWIMLLEQSSYVEQSECQALQQAASELIALLVASIKTTRKNTSADQTRHHY